MRFFLIIVITILVQGCNSEGIGCFKEAGDESSITISVPLFSEIDISSNIDVILIHDSTNLIKMTAGSNELTGISAEVKDGILYLDNLNTCNWTRRYKNPSVELSYLNLWRITLRGSGLISSSETIKLEALSLISTQGSGDYRLILDVQNLTLVSNEIANYYLEGSVNNLEAGLYFTDGIFYCQDLKVNNCNLTHRGTNSMHLNVSENLTGSIDGFGDVVLYDKAPQFTDVVLNSTGRVITKY